jgi:predicted kinase
LTLTLYALCGLPFAGKSTLATALAKNIGAVAVRLDAINHERGLGLDGSSIPSLEWQRTYDEAYRRIADQLDGGQSVIFDHGNFTRAERERVRSIGAHAGALVQIIHVLVSPEVARRRWLRNRQTRERYDLRDDDFDLVVRIFEPPDGEPEVVTIHDLDAELARLRTERARLILIDGIPGSGKSVVAQTIARRMRESSLPVRWCYEEELDHPIYLFSDAVSLKAVTDDLLSGAFENIVAAALAKWRRFAEEARHADATIVVDGTFFGYLTWMFQYLDRPEAETFAYARSVEDALEPLAPRLVYLRQRDVAATMGNLVFARGRGWAERAIRKVTDSIYARAHGLDDVDGFDAFTRFWSAYQALEERLFDTVRLTKLAVDVSVGSWAAAEDTIAAWLELPPAQPIDAGDVGRFAGTYRAADGSVAHVEEVNARLCVRGLHHVWPGQRLIPVGSHTFEVQSLPFTIRFHDEGMRVEGPELLGGRPADELVRLTAS